MCQNTEVIIGTLIFETVECYHTSLKNKSDDKLNPFFSLYVKCCLSTEVNSWETTPETSNQATFFLFSSRQDDFKTNDLVFSRFYLACGWRTSLCSLLTGAILEATVAIGARSSLLCPPPQCPNSHAVLKGAFQSFNSDYWGCPVSDHVTRNRCSITHSIGIG